MQNMRQEFPFISSTRRPPSKSQEIKTHGVNWEFFRSCPTRLRSQKTHRCSICGLEFPLGQALGGHMRRHRAAPNNVDTASTASKDAVTQPPFLPALPVLKRSNSSKRVLSLDLSLALPMYQNDSELQMEKVTRPLLKCFI
ncbi:hypothetical protein OIU76_020613 [Salix suchowensis]|nr:hypothetical protein OIU76_020613 [Salix suchowensis]